ncbi:hypothetical protein FHS95_002722 [Sphingomonas naasensis]|uniref:DUF2541 family protein n=1 Tax=Sphingomonas naasensis TaxID=1344951 RepID=A0A4S1WN43_9SPHN|nr:hypothetical protein [Sphingomonas naasensis]NIJ21030.1 hypothetical protein [Sphingomonas naasensis]TGX43407.1 hypothetical protein E5A74_09635 [Sphingomonas naasensis]
MRTPALLMILVPLLASAPAEAQRRVLWDRVGSTEIREGWTRATIWAPGRQRYREVRLCVTRRALRVNSFTINFPLQPQGRWAHEQVVPLNRTISPGQCSRETWIRGGARDIRQVEIRFARFQGGTRPVVRLEAR